MEGKAATVAFESFDKIATAPSSRKLIQVSKVKRKPLRSREAMKAAQQHHRLYYIWFFGNLTWAILAFPLGVGAISLARNYQKYREKNEYVGEWKRRWAPSSQPTVNQSHIADVPPTTTPDKPYQESGECRKPRVIEETPWKPPFTDPIEDYPPADPVKGPIFCVFNHSSYRRDKDWAFRTGLINGHLCTHVIYASAKVSGEELTSADPEYDLVKEGFKNLALLKTKYPHLKVLVSFGDYERSTANISLLASSPKRRTTFAQNILSWLVENDYDGIHVHWTIPDAGACGSPEDGRSLTKLVSRFRTLFPPNYTIALTVPPFRTQRNGYMFDDLVTNVDYFVIQTHDIYGSETNVTHCMSPYTSSGPSVTKSLIGIVEDMPPYTTQKICFSLSFSALSLHLIELPPAGRPSVPSRTVGPGIEGNYTRTKGRMAFYEVCALGNPGSFLDFKEICAYKTHGNNWVGYESPTSLSSKVSELFRKFKIGCTALWDIDMDDTKGVCGMGRTPLLESVYKEVVSSSTKTHPAAVPKKNML